MSRRYGGAILFFFSIHLWTYDDFLCARALSGKKYWQGWVYRTSSFLFVVIGFTYIGQLVFRSQQRMTNRRNYYAGFDHAIPPASSLCELHPNLNGYGRLSAHYSTVGISAIQTPERVFFLALVLLAFFDGPISDFRPIAGSKRRQRAIRIARQLPLL